MTLIKQLLTLINPTLYKKSRFQWKNLTLIKKTLIKQLTVIGTT